MENRGLKPYTKQICADLGTAKSYLNINKNNANLIIDIPIISSTKIHPISVNIMFNYQNKNQSSVYGNGIRLNYEQLYIKDSNTIEIYKIDGTTEEYVKVENEDKLYKNEETLKEIKKVISSSSTYYLLSDKYQNQMKYDGVNSIIPCSIRTNSKEIYTITNDGSTVTINNSGNDVITITKEDNVITFEYTTNFQDNIEKSLKTELILDDSNNISEVKYYNYNSETSSYNLFDKLTISFTSSRIIIKNESDNHTVIYLLNNDLITTIKEYENSNGVITTTIDYVSDYKTVVTNYNGKKDIYYFDENYYPVNQISNTNIVSGTKFNNNKLVERVFGPISVINDANNLLYNKTLSNFTKNGVTLSKVASSDSDLSSLITPSLYKITGTGTLTYTLNTRVIESDVLTLCMCIKHLSTFSQEKYIKIEVLGDCINYIFTNESLSSNYEFVSFSNKVNSSSSKVTIKFTFVGDASIEIGNILLFNKSFGSFYNYDESKNLLELNSGDESYQLDYNSSNQIDSSTSANSKKTRNEYNSINKISKAIEPYEVNIQYYYDSYGNNNKKIIRSPYKQNRIMMSSEYVYDSVSIEKQYSLTQYELVRTAYDIQGRKIYVKDMVNNAIKNYIYDNDLLTEIQFQDENNICVNYNYEYDYSKRISKIICPDGMYFYYMYDNYSNIKSVFVNNKLLINYQYNDKLLLTKVLYSTNEEKKYEYNSDLLLEKEYYVNSSGTETLLYQYEYDKRYQLSKIKDANNNTLKEIQYDINGQVIKVIENNSEIKYQYDNLGNIINEERTFDDLKVNQSYDTIDRSKGSNSSNLDNYFNSQDTILVASFLDDLNAKSSEREVIGQNINLNGSTISFTKKYDGIIPYVPLSSSNYLQYQLTMRNETLLITGSIGFWFKSSSLENKSYLFSSKSSSRSSYIGVYIKNNYLYLEVIDDDGNNQVLCNSSYQAKDNEWNYFALSFENRHDAEGYDDCCEYTLMLNSKMDKFSKKNPRLNVEMDQNAVYNIGCKYDGSSYTQFFTGNIAVLFVGPNKYTCEDKLLEYYKITKDYLVDNQYNDDETNAVDFGVGRLNQFTAEDINDYKIFIYHNMIESINGDKPVLFDQRTLLNIDKDRTFNFNNKAKDYCLVLDGNRLRYNINLSNAGTILAKVLFDAYNDKQYIFEYKDTNNNIIGLYRNSSQALTVEYNDQVEVTTLKIIDNNVWNNIGLSFAGDASEFRVKVYLNNVEYECPFTVATSMSSGTLSVGAKHNNETITNVLSMYSTNYPLYGLVEYMIIKENSYLDKSKINNLILKMNTKKKINYYDELGFKRKSEIINNDESLITNYYEYKKENTYSTTDVSKETIKVESNVLTTRQYQTDKFSRITNVNDSVFGNHTYTYNSRGFLLSDNTTTYSYDSNGNILTKGNTSYTYTNGKLTKVGDEDVIYATNNIFYIKQIGNKQYSYENNKLKEVINNQTNIKTQFTYNANGLRESKIVYNLTKNTTFATSYIYSGNRLIREESEAHCFDFLYDENNLLYGFIFKNQAKYYYIRDITGLILGIVNEQGELITKYGYDAYGSIISITDTSGESIGLHNPFRYKGYYYDDETGLFYCNSRYYSLELCRWISPDSIEYLDPESINGLNLYVYCGNDPINYVDPSGHIAISTLILCGLALVGMGLTIGGVASDNNTMTAIGLTMVAIPAVISGVGALFSGATYLSIIGGVTVGAGLFTGTFATAEYQEAFTGNNWIIDTTGMSEELYNGLMLTTAAIATAGTIATGVLTSVGNATTPNQMMNSLQNHPNRWKTVKELVEPARGGYRGGTSTYTNYINKWTGSKLGTHKIIRTGRFIHGPHFHPWI